jgi:SagB-type dehydrogenase family enzyme
LHEDDPLIEFATRCYKWAAFGYRDAAYIHAASFAYPFLNYAEPGAYKLDEHFMNAYRIVADPPSPFKTNSAVIKTYKITKPIDYPSVRFEEVSSLINCPSDSTTRACKASLSSSDLDLFLHFSFGVTKVVTKDGVSLVRKVVPSGGARHPTEAYLIFLTDHFYPRGVYHFNTQDDGQLDALVFQDCGSRLDQALYGVLSQVRQADQEPLFCLVLTSVVRRAMWRYRDIRSSRAVFIDMGHVIQNAENCASLLNLKKLADFPFREKELSCILGIDYLEEPCLRACLFG